MATLGVATLQTDVNLKGLDKGLKQGQAKTKSGFKSMGQSAKKALVAGVAAGAALAATAVAKFASDSVAEFQAFEKGAAEVFTLMPGISSAAMESMKGDVLSFSAEVGRSTDETLPALYQAISAGVPAENVFDFMQVASDAALGGVTDLETAVDGITSVTNAYGVSVIDAATASDVMFTAVKLGKTDFEQLSNSLFNVIPTAASLGVKFEDVAANLAALTAQGTPTSVATTQLRAAFVEASKSGTNLDKALQNLSGKTFAELIASGKTSSQIFTELRGSMPEQDFRNLFSSVEAANAVMGLTNDTAAGIIDSFGTVEDTVGATAAAAETMAGSMEHLENKVGASTERLKILVGEALEPGAKSALEFANNTITLAGNLIELSNAADASMESLSAEVDSKEAAIEAGTKLAAVSKDTAGFFAGITGKTQDLNDKMTDLAIQWGDFRGDNEQLRRSLEGLFGTTVTLEQGIIKVDGAVLAHASSLRNSNQEYLENISVTRSAADAAEHYAGITENLSVQSRGNIQQYSELTEKVRAQQDASDAAAAAEAEQAAALLATEEAAAALAEQYEFNTAVSNDYQEASLEYGGDGRTGKRSGKEPRRSPPRRGRGAESRYCCCA